MGAYFLFPFEFALSFTWRDSIINDKIETNNSKINNSFRFLILFSNKVLFLFLIVNYIHQQDSNYKKFNHIIILFTIKEIKIKSEFIYTYKLFTTNEFFLRHRCDQHSHNKLYNLISY